MQNSENVPERTEAGEHEACPYYAKLYHGSLNCQAGAVIGDGKRLGVTYADRYCRGGGYRGCPLYEMVEGTKKS